MSALKPCPLCGGNAHIETYVLGHFYFADVVCAKCKLYLIGEGARTKEQAEQAAAEKWNKRP